LETEIIRFSLAKQGRKHTGKKRCYDTARLAQTINSPRVQERVKAGDMQGYYGHWPRIKFGLNPAEGGIDPATGRVVTVEPAFRTTYLRADTDGTVEHRALFLDNGPGKLAARLYQNKTGGFSGVIDQITPDFYGFDYVLEPNFLGNRGWEVSLDGAALKDMAVALDDAAAFDYRQHVQSTLLLLDSVQKQYDALLKNHAAALAENEVYRSLLAAGRGGDLIALDDASGFRAPVAVRNEGAREFAKSLADFNSAVLPRIMPPADEEKIAQYERSPMMRRLLGSLGIGRE
jgi:hypothetical protein